MRGLLRSVLLGLVLVIPCTLIMGCGGEGKVDPKKDAPVMDNVPEPAP